MPGRRFKHDFYWESARLAVEVNGGTWIPGAAHSGGAGIERDYEKAALTALQGVWTLFVSGRQVRSGQALAWIEALLNRSGVTSGKQIPNEAALFYSGIHTGLIVQNVNLFCASEGLGTVTRLRFDRPALEKKLGLREEQYITLVQSVGYLKESK